MDVPEPFALESAKRSAQYLGLVANRLGADGPIPAVSIPLEADALGNIEDNRDRQDVVLPGKVKQRLSCFLGCTLVASITVNFAAASRLAAMKRRTSKASLVAAWLFSSPETRYRQ